MACTARIGSISDGPLSHDRAWRLRRVRRVKSAVGGLRYVIHSRFSASIAHLSNFRPKRFAKLGSQSEVVAEVVDKGLPLLGIHVVLTEDEVAPHMCLKDANLYGRSASKLLQSQLPA